MKNIIWGIVIMSFVLGSCVSKEEASTDFTVEKVADGFQFIEGPVWKEGKGLFFSDIPASKVYLYTPGQGVEVYLEDSGNSNGLILDAQGRLLMAQHGSRQVGRLEEDGSITSLASSYEGTALNSPNDLVLHSSGALYFTDPPFGLMDVGLSSDLGFSGIYRVDSEGNIALLDKDLELPNGLAFSPDESYLYADDSRKCILYRWKVLEDGSLAEKEEFAKIPVSGYADGMKLDEEGNLYVTGPDGLWVFSPEGTLLQHVSIPGQNSASNCAWGDEDGMSLYVTSNNALYRVRINPDSLN